MQLVNGLASNASACVTGFDQVSFMMGSSASIFNVCDFFVFPYSGCSEFWQAVDGSNGNFTGFNNENGDISGMQFLYGQLSSKVQSRSLNVANWPNVSGNFAAGHESMSYAVKGISRCQP